MDHSKPTDQTTSTAKDRNTGKVLRGLVCWLAGLDFIVLHAPSLSYPALVNLERNH